EKRKQLEDIVHPAIYELLIQNLKESNALNQKKPWFYEASLLFETGNHTKFREVWCTYCSDAEQLRRLMARDRISEAEALSMIRSQMPTKLKLQRADVAINTET